MRPPAVTVYIISEPRASLVKIGRTTNLRGRLSSLSSCSPAPLIVRWSIAGDPRLEIALHDAFADRRHHGEWFEFGDLDPVAEVKAMIRRRGLLDRPLSAILAPPKRVRLDDRPHLPEVPPVF